MEINCQIVLEEDLYEEAHHYLFTLYRPLMGLHAAVLYEILCAMEYKVIVLQDLLDLTQLTKSQYLEARKKLEQFMLLSTYTNEKQTYYEFHLYAPMAPDRFLRHEIFSRMLVANLSSGQYERLKELYLKPELPDTLKNITEEMDPDLLDENWSDKKEAVYRQFIPSLNELDRYDFDWERFFRGMQRTIPTRLRTKENMSRIAYLAHMYAVDEDTMQKYVVRAIPSSRNAINFDLVMSSLSRTTKTKKIEEGKTPSPIQYYHSTLPRGVRILESEEKIIVSLVEKYRFSDEVANELLRYCLEECQQRFNEKFILKVAGSWSRNHVDSLEKARAQENQEPFGTSIKARVKAPDWYYEKSDQKPSEELFKQVLEAQQRLGAMNHDESI